MKSETNFKQQIRNSKRRRQTSCLRSKASCVTVWNLLFGSLGFVSNFEFRISNLSRLAIVACLMTLLGGCAAPTATLDLIAVARAGLADARDAQRQSHETLIRQFSQQQAALDAAFDADVRLAEAGAIRDAQGNPVALDGRWVIAARKGYVAARDAVAQQAVAAQAAHATRLDNLAAADDALHMACTLIIEQQGLNIRMRQYLQKATSHKPLATR